MLKLLFCLNILILITPNELHLDDNSFKDEPTGKNLWFPLPPDYQKDQNSEIATVAGAVKTSDKNYDSESPGLWFPHPSNYQTDIKLENATLLRAVKTNEVFSEKNYTTDWSHLWFPYTPNFQTDNSGGKNVECDNGKYNIRVDFDPDDKRHSYNYLCIANRTCYDPNLNTSALIKEDLISPAYEPPVKCVSDIIEYTELLPTFGAYRPLAPKFGTYKFLPPQRWLHSLADGAIVLLYHPCAFAGQIKQLQNILRGCLYRHIITPSILLTPQRPLALLAWGKSLKMSVIDDDIVVKFIKNNAKMGFRHKSKKLNISSELYDAGLLIEAHLVTDDQDEVICGYKEMR